MYSNPSGGLRRARQFVALLALVPVCWATLASATPAPLQEIQVVSDASGSRLQVDGRDFMVLGMNWGYMPIGQNYSYDFWGQPDEFIETALAREMSLLKEMGVNTIRHYVGMPPRWVQYVYETYGIYSAWF